MPSRAGEIPVVDALLTDQVGVGVLVRVADCTPVVLVGLDEPVAGVIHCGREGLVRGVVPAAIGALRDRGAESLEAWVGPARLRSLLRGARGDGGRRGRGCPGGAVDDVVGHPGSRRRRRRRGAACVSSGVQVNDLGDHVCTIEDERFFSYRRQGQDSGRFGAVAVIR